MIILGIDPGTRRVGYGLIEKTDGQLRLVDAGLLKIAGSDDAAALVELRSHLSELIKTHRPDRLAVEKLFFSQNRTTALQVAQARGVVLLTATEAGIPIFEYAPNEVKAAVTGHGLSDKEAVLKMVRLILGVPNLDVIDDASDALALAIVGGSAGTAVEKKAFRGLDKAK
ncbi:MAG TPA: crossover junction endodeoxyribonuclease RuvC [Candidatus Paceibacterota bacterium]|nr:crossover junction endodeoxyribonuclease RuvC [Candidatus Paceibacterota bacterium]